VKALRERGYAAVQCMTKLWKSRGSFFETDRYRHKLSGKPLHTLR
jgi:hypothetical protein